MVGIWVVLSAIFLLIQLLHESIYQTVLDQLVKVYKQVSIGDPLEKGTLLGPLHTTASKESFLKGIQTIRSQVNFYIDLCSNSLSTMIYAYMTISQ
jgi:hypothetical protein